MRNVLTEPQMAFGTRDCRDGYEGHLDDLDRFSTCHLKIYIPSDVQRNSTLYLTLGIIGFVILAITYSVLRRRLKRSFALAKIERRRSRRSSESSAARQTAGAFGHN
mmetsp:Transcript_14720/g.44268  ORF Transcript_14720/g.44268 Transcript_14720/m.44268 type:complete len:107 (-) Transcript_14720:369-689(-)